MSVEEDDEKTLIIHFDGSSREGNKYAAYGIWCKTTNVGYGRPLRNGGTCNAAEFLGCLRAIKEARRMHRKYPRRYTKTIIRGDSKLVIEGVRGNWNIRHENLVPLLARVRRLLDRIPSSIPITFEHILRAKNTRADKYAGDAVEQLYKDETSS